MSNPSNSAMNFPCFVNPVAGKLASTSAGSKSSKTLQPFSTAPSPIFANHVVSNLSAPTLHTELAPAFFSTGHLHDGAVGKGTGTIIVLFRSDLRLDDHPALNHAVEEAARIIPVYCFDPRHFGKTDYGFEKTGKYRAKFLLQSVADLRSSLQKKGADLIVRMGKPENEIPALCKKVGAKQVFVHREVTYEEQQVEKNLEKALKENNAELRMFWANTLYHEDDLPFGIQSMPDVYSDFRESVERSGTIREPLQAPKDLPELPQSLRPADIPTLRQLGIDDSPNPSRYSASNMTGVSAITGGESEAMRRVQAYIQDARNSDLSNSPRSKVTAHLGADFSCRISPWLALGCISPRRIFNELKKASPSPKMLLRSSTYYELVWRDFFRCITTKYAMQRSDARKTRGKSLAHT